MNIQNKIIYWAKVFALYLPFIILLAALKVKGGHIGDLQCWSDWSKFSFNNGLNNIYKSWTDYLPLYHYVLFLFGKLQGSEQKISQNIYQLKYFTLLFDFASTLLIFKILDEKFKNIYQSLFYTLFFLLNIAIMYNTVIWGQVDSIFSFFVLLSILSAYKKRLLLSTLSFVVAINFKLQAGVFIPLFLALILPLCNKNNLKNVVLSIVLAIALQFLIVLPFIIAGDFNKMIFVVTNSFNKYPLLSLSASNMWHWFFPVEPYTIPSTGIFLYITYKKWGLFLFFIVSGIILMPFIKGSIFYLLKGIKPNYNQKQVIIVGALIPLLFFFLNAQMHERYSHPALLFLALYALYYQKYLVLFTGSLAYFLNLDYVMRYVNSNYYGTVIYLPEFIAFIYLTTIVLLLTDLAGYNISIKKSNTENPVSIHNSFIEE